MLDFKNLNPYEKITFIFQNLQLIVGLVGIVGNILTICVFQRERLRKYSYSFYCRAMACSDILVLLHTFRHWSAFVLGADLDLIGPFFCTMDEFLVYVTTFTSLWLLTLISLDRLMTIIFPNRFKVVKSRWFQATLVLIVVVYSSSVNILFPIYNRLVFVHSNKSNYSYLECYLPPAASNWLSWLYLDNLFISTMFINIVLNVKMIHFLVSSRRKFNKYGQPHQHNSRLSSKDRKFILTSIGLNICCLICKLPFTIAMILFTYIKVEDELFDMIFTINVMIMDMDNGASFFVNIFVNSIFKEEFLYMFRLKSNSAALIKG